MGVAERWLLAAVAWWGIVAHTTHLLVSMGLCALLVGLSLTPWKRLANRRGPALAATAIVAFAAFSQIAFHVYLYGKPTLNGNPPPYLMARAISDGPAALYLQGHCSQLNWTICKQVDFLWEIGGVWESASETEKNALRKEKMPLVKATLRTYPRAQLPRSLSNFRGNWSRSASTSLPFEVRG